MTSNKDNEITIQDDSIFSFVKPDNNDEFSKMEALDLQDLIILLDNYYLELRNKLGFTDDITFGLELEFEYANRREIDNKLQNTFPGEKWKTKVDSSLMEGAEIATPILKDEPIDWDSFRRVCEIVNHHAKIDLRAGGHIHIGAQILGCNTKNWLNFLKLWSIYENIIFRFCYGEYLSGRPYIYEYACPLALDIKNISSSLESPNTNLDDILTTIGIKKYQAINFDNVDADLCDKFTKYNTIEFRCPNGSIDPVIWQNNVNFLGKMLSYSTSSDFDYEKIEFRKKLNLDKFSTLEWYNEIYLDQALELCDMIFKNNLDKVYFLRQYLKSFEVCDDFEHYQKASKFTRTRIKS